MIDRLLKKLSSCIRKRRMQKLYNKIVNKKWDGKENYEKEVDFLKRKKEVLVFPYEFQDKYRPELEWVGEDKGGVLY